MKITFFLSLLTISQIWATEAYSQFTKLSMKLEDVKISEALKVIENQSDFFFLYSPKLIDVETKVNIDVKEETIKDILPKIFGDDVKFVVYDRQIILSPVEHLDTSVDLLQQNRISGTVTDKAGNSLPGVNIVVTGSTLGAISDINGKYSLEIPAGSKSLTFSFIGMEQQEVMIGTQNLINVTMAESATALEEVVVVGYGVQKKSLVTGAISSISSDDMANSSISRAEQALQGKTSGVQVIQASGAPGADLNVRIRGYGSNKSSEPIYLVNGTRVTSLSTVDPNNIKNIEVLKDAASSAIYGAEGANGVVLVTTKTGGAGKGIITYEHQYSLQSMAKEIKVLNAADYIQYSTEAGTLPPAAASSIYDTNWQREIYETSPTQKHYLSFTGGSDKGSFMVSLSYLNQDGIVVGDQDTYKRYSLMFNSDHKINNWIKIGHSLTISSDKLKSIKENSEYSSVITSALMLNPLMPAYYETEDDIPAIMKANIAAGKKYMKNSDGKYFGVPEYFSSALNPFVLRDRNFPLNENNTLFGNLYVDFTPLKGLTLTSRLGGRILSDRYHQYDPTYYYEETSQNVTSMVTESMEITNYWQLENYANYMLSIGDHHGTILLGMSSSENVLKGLKANGSPLTVDNNLFDDLDYLASNPTDNVSSSVTLTHKLSYFGRLNYDFKNIYMVQFSLRRDAAGSDYLPVANRWGTFPAASVGWVVSSEDFFPESVLTFLKVRASWGQNGSLSNLGNFSYLGGLTSATVTQTATIPNSYPLLATGSAVTNISATAPANLSNFNLKWETSEQSDFGIDIRAFNDRLAITMDYYIKKTKDLLTTGAPLYETGNAATIVNAGDVENRGFEFEASYRNKIGKLDYSVGGNFATLHNEVTYMNPTQPFLTGTTVNLQPVTRFDLGNPIWYFHGYKTKGIDPETGKTIFYKADGSESTTVTVADKQYIGSGIPKINYGFNIDLSYSNFDFKAFLQGAAGHDILLGMVRTDRLNFNKLQVYFDNRWTPSNKEGTMPSANADANTWFSDFMVFDGDYLKIKQMQLGYTVPQRIMNIIAASAGRVYISVENLHTFTKYPGSDPEIGVKKSTDGANGAILGDSYINSIGVDRGMYPVSRTIIFGASISF